MRNSSLLFKHLWEKCIKEKSGKEKMAKLRVQPVFLLTFSKDAVKSRQQAKKQKIHHVKMSIRNQLLILLRFPLRDEGDALVCRMAERRLSW